MRAMFSSSGYSKNKPFYFSLSRDQSKECLFYFVIHSSFDHCHPSIYLLNNPLPNRYLSVHTWSTCILLGRSVNQPKFFPNASWNLNATTFASNGTVGNSPYTIFVDSNNTVVVARWDNGQILIWRNNSINLTTTIVANLSHPQSLFVLGNDEIFVDNGNLNHRVGRWTSNGTRLQPPMSVCSPCSGLFVDINNNLYCSQTDSHQVVRTSLNSPENTMTIVAGEGCSGSTANMLNQPWGIFVTMNLGLYIADYGNDRIQLLRSGQVIATTVVGNGSNETIALNRPTGVVLDGDGYLFIVDSGNHRILGSGAGGFRCVVGCSGQGSGSHQLNNPITLSFDTNGNIFVTDVGNGRIQKFSLITNSCGE